MIYDEANAKKKQYKLYQIHLTDAEIDLINAEGHDAVHKQSLKLDMSFSKNDTGAVAREAFDLGYYTCLLYTSDAADE